MNEVEHIPVMADEVLEYLAPQPDETALDGTLGMAGHALLMAERVGEGGRLIGLDQDPQALEKARARLASCPTPHDLVHTPYAGMREALDTLGVAYVDRILLDIGVSSFQLDTAARGFSFGKDGPLDMRMDTTAPLTAQDIVMEWSAEEIGRIIREYGEERHWRRITKEIVDVRARMTIDTTGALASLIERLAPRRQRIHPATRTFQAFRIAVNDELGQLEQGLEAARRCLRAGGRLAVITFHSLEDRLAKQITRGWAQGGGVRLINKKVIKPTREECVRNRRARSAKLRVVEIEETI